MRRSSAMIEFFIVQIGSNWFHSIALTDVLSLFELQLARISSDLAFETDSWKASLHTITGAVPQLARHSTNSRVYFRSLVVCGPCSCGSRPSWPQRYSCNL